MAQPISAPVNPLFLPLQLFLIGLDVLISLVTFGWINVLKTLSKGKALRSVPIGDDASHRCSPGHTGGNLVTIPKNGATTIHECFAKSVEKHGSSVAMRKRAFLGWKSKKVKHFSTDSTDLTYDEVGEKAYKFGAALAAAGCVPSDPVGTLERVTTPCRICIFENTCPEWMIAALGAFSQSIGVATVYATLGIDSVVEVVVDNSISVVVCNKANAKYLTESSNKMPGLKTIVYTNDLIGPETEVDMPTEVPPGLTVVSFEDFVASGDTEKHPVVPPAAESAAVIMYTSGSTGKPKGVVVKHSALVASIASSMLSLPLDETASYLGYLPLAHIMELVVELTMLSCGARISYTDPRSLMASGSYPEGALEFFKPTHLVAVPKIWETIKKAVVGRVKSSHPVLRAVVNTGLRWRLAATAIGLDTPLFNALVFKKFQKMVGGNMKYAISGGGPLNGDAQTFIRIAFGFPLFQGYGLTETCGPMTVQDPTDTLANAVGGPTPSVEVKLVSTPEIRDPGGKPYLSTDREDADGNPVWGRGEVLVRGNSLGTGYYDLPEKTGEVFLEGSWFATGDIGQFLGDGSLRIVDRKKNLVKLLGGEYVALERMEVVYGNVGFVDAAAGGICCYGDGGMDRCIALVQVSRQAALGWAKTSGLLGTDEKDDEDDEKTWQRVRDSKELYDRLMESFAEEHANSDLGKTEKLVGIAILDTPWTPENGCLTASAKLQRRKVLEVFANEFEAVRKKGIFG